MSNQKAYLVTGAAGFIGAALIKALLKSGKKVIGVDNMNNYYDPSLKKARLKDIQKTASMYIGEWDFFQLSIENIGSLNKVFSQSKPSVVINLAAQAGVRYSIENPNSYIQSNLVGFGNILECCRNNNIESLIYASSSSVYGGNTKLPFSEKDAVNHPVSLYAATKKANELMAHSYSHLYGIPMTGLRFFTVYGPWGRPDMAPMIFVKSILEKTPIKVFNRGLMKRDFTYIDDVVAGIIACINKPALPNKNFDPSNPDPSSSFAAHRIFNIGNSCPIELIKFIELIERNLGINAIKDLQPMQAGDVIATSADTKLIEGFSGYKPSTPIEVGIKKFIDWYKNYYKF